MTTKLEHPMVVIFGAGASRGGLDGAPGVPPPVDKDFFDIANQIGGHGTLKLARKVLKDVWQLYRKTNGVGLEFYYRDLETRALINEFAKTANQPKNWSRRKRELDELIRRVFIHTTIEGNPGARVIPRESKIHKAILERLNPGDTIITFNYDLIIEESFSSAQLWNPVDGYGIQTSGKTKGWAGRWLEARHYENKRSKLLLLKLHGSLNWNAYSGAAGIRLKPKPYFVSRKKGETRFENILILAPGWKKAIDVNPYKSFWREARLRLEKCKTLIILGYSLPETDLLAQSLFGEVVRTRAARRKKFIKQLHLADHEDSVKDRFNNLFTPALGPHGKVFKYYDLDEFNNWHTPAPKLARK
jgi:hypothetical protein